ncbi:ABC transporter substrate-binding protein [Paenibacillus sp. Soil750]|uniref:ABC transporter substrate-binding protein n=1 Tax=Paenibacillus sp. Soil750 TaxID=1736398 RepID=UPI0006F2F38C|nr:ABC transporter substrate-binding protein [Paenibacillus sp. Soil750]KRE69761.1 hypothetical protein ASL11_15465 [Paenibacillus sp. Soil750]
MKRGKLLVSTGMVVTMLTLAACGNSAGTSSPNATATDKAGASSQTPATAKAVKTLTLVVHSSWVRPGFQAVVDLVNFKSAELGAKIELEKIAEGDAGDQVVQTKFAAGEPPDILSWYDATWSSKLGGSARLEDLSGDWMKNYDSKALDTPKYKSDGKLIVAPFGEVGTMSMFYNKKVFQDNGLQVPKDWKEFLAVSEQLKAKGITPVYFAGKDAWTLQIIPLVGAVRDSKDKVTPTADGLSTNKTHFTDLKLFVDSISKVKELADKQLINKTFLSDDDQSSRQALLDGKIAMYAMGSWIVPDLVKADKDKANNIGAFGIPFDEGQLINISPPSGLWVPSESKNKELAKKVVAFMVSQEAQQAYFKAQPDIPFAKGIQVNGLVPAQQDIKKLIDEGKSFQSPLDYTKYQKGPFEKYLQDMLVGGKTPVDVAKELDNDFAKAAKAKQDPNWSGK